MRPWLFLFYLLMKSWVFAAAITGCIALFHRNGFPRSFAAAQLGLAAMGAAEFAAFASIGGARGGITRDAGMWFAIIYWSGHALLFVGQWALALYMLGWREFSDVRKFWPFGK